MDIPIILSLMRTLKQLRKRDHWTRAELEAYQLEALGRLREFAYGYSPFYQRFHRGVVDQPLHELPVLTKAMLMEHFDELVTDRTIRLADVRAHVAHATEGERYLDRYWVNATSGSTGHPGLFLFNRAEWTMVLASFARAHEWAGVAVNLRHRMKMASVASVSPWHMSAQVGATVQSWWMPALRLAASDPLESIVQQLNDWQPALLIAYASMARILTDEQLTGRLHIAPHIVYTSSEVLTAETRRRIEAAWGQPPFNQYAATECGGLAGEYKEDRRLHMFEDLAMLEVVDEHNRPVPPGVYGAKVLLTVLFNRTQPLIRYELSDSLRLDSSHGASGLPFAIIDGIQGRVEDVLHMPAMGSGEIAVQPNVFHVIMDTVPASGWQVVQEDDGLRILLSGVSDGFSLESLADVVTKALADRGVSAPRVLVQRVALIPKTGAGKAPLIKSNLSSVSPIHGAALNTG